MDERIEDAPSGTADDRTYAPFKVTVTEAQRAVRFPFYKVYALGQVVPRPVRRALALLVYRAVFHRREKRNIILITIPKSGTHFFTIFMANYMNIMTGRPDGPVKIDSVFTEIIRNPRDRFLQRYYVQDPHPFFDRTPYDDFMVSHGTRFIEHCPGRILFLYRNPLDQMISWFHYRYKWDTGAEEITTEIIDEALDHYIEKYNLMMGLRGRGRVLPVTYESLMRAPVTTLVTVFDWLALPLDMEALEKALAFSDRRAVQSYEANVGIINRKGKDSPLVRSGEVGQWKSVFSQAHLDHIRRRLAGGGIDLNAFILE